MSRPPLTPTQKRVLDFVVFYTAKHGYAPTLEEICVEMRVTSLSTVHKHLLNLAFKGYIRRRWNAARAIELLADDGRPSETLSPREQRMVTLLKDARALMDRLDHQYDDARAYVRKQIDEFLPTMERLA